MAKIGVGLDIGTSSVKIVELERGKKITVSRFGIWPLPDGALNGGVVANGVAVGAAIKELLRLLKVRQKNVIVAIAGQAVIVRHIKMPYMSREEAANAIRWEAERYIPFSIEEVDLDFQVIEADQEQNEIEVMLVCAHKDILNSHLLTLREAGLQPLAVDLQPFALMRALGLESPKDDGNVALVDIGAGTTDLTVLKAGIPRFTRIIPIAGNHLTNSIRNQLGLDYETAEKAKIADGDAFFNFGNSAPETREYKVNYALQAGLKELGLELRRSLDYYKLQQRDDEVKNVQISGGGSKLKNLIPFLQNELGLPTRNVACDEALDCPEKTKAEFNDAFPVLTVAIGLALREVTEE